MMVDSNQHHCKDQRHYCSICEERMRHEQDEAEIQEILEGWNWNASIFDMYDELKDGDLGDEDRQSKILHRAYRYFKSEDTKKMIDELHYHIFGYTTTKEEANDSSNN